MSQASAIADAQYLGSFLTAHGVTYSIELQPGRPGPSDTWHAAKDFRAVLDHHTVSKPSQGLTPCLALVKRGRPDVPGPLCNGYGGYDEVARIICMAWANHPGAGGALTMSGPYGSFVVPLNVARPYMFGWEFEGGLEAWSSSMHDFMARCSAATLEWVWSKRLGRRVSGEDLSGYQGEHSTWTDRKIDRLDYSTAEGRARTRVHLLSGGIPSPAPEPEDDEVKRLMLVREKSHAEVWLCDFITRRHIPNEAVLGGVQYHLKRLGGDPEVVVIEDGFLDVFGAEHPDMPTVV